MIRTHVPKGRRLPKGFAALTRAASGGRRAAGVYFRLGSVDPEPLAWAGARAVLVPFLVLGDGGFVALWYFAAEPAVVHCDSEGGQRVVASDFDDFLLRLKRARTGVPDLDGASAGRQPPPHGIELGTRRTLRPLAELAKQLRRVVAKAAPKPARGTTAELLRKSVVRSAAKLVAARRFEPYRPRDDWSLLLRIVTQNGAWQLETFENAGWYPVDDAALLAGCVALQSLTRDPARKRHEITIMKHGLVSFDHDRQLLLEPPSP